jgi:hypothetical protein
MKFRLLKAHYVRVENKEDYYEQPETFQDGAVQEKRVVRCRCDRYLNPDDPSMWNWDPLTEKYRNKFRSDLGEFGWLVITTKAEGHKLELVVPGITLEMEGIDEASQAVIDKLREESLPHPIDALRATGGI